MSRLARAWTWAPLAAGAYAAALLWRARSYVPLWDGREYADCIVAAARAPLALSALRCAGHASHAYVGLVAIVQRLAPGRFALLLATNAVLLAFAAWGLARLCRAVAPGAALDGERALVVAAFLVHPVVLASVVQPGLDFGVMVWLLWATVAAAERRPWMLAGFGLLAAFTKETGLLVYAVIAATYALVYALPRPVPRDLRNATFGAVLGVMAAVAAIPSTKLGLPLGLALGAALFLVLRPRPLPRDWTPDAVVGRLLPLAPLALPGLALVGYLAYRATLPRESVLWAGESGGAVVRAVLAPQFGPTSRNYLALTFVLGFLWVPSAALLVDALVGVRRHVVRRPRRETPGIAPLALAIVTPVTVGTVYVLTRYVTFGNARYVLPAYPLVLVMLLPALVRLHVPAPARRALLGLTTVLLAWSAVRTSDPVSRALWGTFRVGDVALLRLTSLTGECCGAGRDQLVYNLQFTAVERLTDAALARVAPVARGRTLAMPRLADWWVVDVLDSASHRALDRSPPAQVPRVLHPEALDAELRTLAQAPPDTLWYLAMPYVDGARALAALRERYDARGVDTVRMGGYAMAVIPLVRRGIDSRPAPADVPQER